ncbi:MAG: hypothetical protein JWO53_816 [Chlamydiia bacterium]|nr:hypothetical protein [Chlamydiia bacterium]
MSRIQAVSQEKASTAIKPIYDALKKKMGLIPNIFLHMGNSPEILRAFIALSDLIETTSLSKELKTKLALVIAEANQCTYCLSAHTAIAKSMSINEEAIMQARNASASDKKTGAILRFAQSVVQKQGNVTDKEVQELKANNVSDQEICEIILIITLNTLTNYFNKVVNTDVDFPLAPKLT